MTRNTSSEEQAFLEALNKKLWNSADLDKISGAFRAWKRGKGYADVKGFCRSATCQEIAGHGYVLSPGRYVGAENVKDDGEPFDQKMNRLVTTLNQQFAEGAKLEKAIRKNLAGLGFGGES